MKDINIKEVVSLLVILGLIVMPLGKGFGGKDDSITKKDIVEEGMGSVEGQGLQQIAAFQQIEQQLEVPNWREEQYYRQQKELNILAFVTISIDIIYFLSVYYVFSYLNNRMKYYRDQRKW
jgi:hypothetical protein